MKRSPSTEEFKRGLNGVAARGSDPRSDLREGLALCSLLPEGETLPQRIELLPAGAQITGRDGRSWRNPHPERVVEFLRQRGCDLVIDFEHATELKAPQGEPAPAAGWLHDFALDDQGRLTAAVRQWTPAGASALQSREYRYLSPVILYHRDSLEIVGLSSVGLTNRPNLHIPALNHEQERTPPMKQLLAKLGLAESASEQEALNALAKIQGDLTAALNRAETPSLDKFVPRADYDAALTRAANAEQKLTETQQAEFTKAVNAEVDAAVQAGKITPATAGFYRATCADQTGLDRFREFVEAAPEIGGKSGLEGKTPEQTGKALNAETAQVAKLFGLTAEDIEKYGR